MFKNYLIFLLLLIFAFYVISVENIKIIFAGIAIFLIGMHFMESGFKFFSDGVLEKILEKITSTNFKSVITGFISTTMVQSSSLISVIVISFLSIELISLAKGVAIIFGANLGSTTTAWIVSSFGLDLKISLFAMPMIIFGVIFRFSKNNTFIGLGNVLLGLGFIFLGISYMKEGFETLKDSIDLASYSIGGISGILVYILIGAIATVVIQSSGATMAIIITALLSGSIIYVDAIALAIGANVGTTVTSVIGALNSNTNGKRLAFAHFIFNIITALIALALINVLIDFVDILSPFLSISENNYAMKLALFHTIFNLIGVILLFPFISKIVDLSKKMIVSKANKASKPIYLDESNMKIPYNAILSIQKEIIHLYDDAQKSILHALGIHTSNLKEEKDIEKVLANPSKIDININEIYQNNLKSLYSQIIDYALDAQKNMNANQMYYVSQLKSSSNIIIKILKDTRDIQRNMNIFLNSKNEYIKIEYQNLKKELVSYIFKVNQLKELDDIEASALIQSYKDNLEELDILINKKIDELIRSDNITAKMGTSLINDSSSVIYICKKLLKVANIIFVDDQILRSLGEENNEII